MRFWLTVSALALCFALVACDPEHSQVSLSKRDRHVIQCLPELGSPPPARCMSAVGGLFAISLVHGTRKQAWVPSTSPAGEELHCGLTWSNGNIHTLEPC